ncbi:MAG: endoglycoceramidase [Acidimicrobiia bacterium]
MDLFGAYGITVMLDMHQDMYNERFQGQGFPAWATYTDVEGVPGSAPPDEMARQGFPMNYFTPPVLRAFDNLWTNRAGLWDEFADFWRHVAARFRDKPNLLGYDLLNEPWPGSQWPSCANPQGCPVFDAGVLQRFYERAAAGIRQADPTGVVWWEPNVTSDFGTANGVGLVSPIEAGPNGISFHTYCLIGGQFAPVSRADDPECPVGEERAFSEQHRAAARNGSALFLTEFGASDDLVDIRRMADLADQAMVSWHWWHYGNWSDPTGNPGPQGLWGQDLDRPGSLKQAKADVLVRAYPQAVAGRPTSFSFDLDTKEFRLDFAADGGITAPTVIFVPVERHYRGGYRVEVSGPAMVTSAPNAPKLTLRNTGTGPVTVRVRPVWPEGGPNPWLGRRVLNIAHQGGEREAPSNTLYAFKEAVAKGADVLELDVHATADGELVVIHDATVDRTDEARRAQGTRCCLLVRARRGDPARPA